MEAFILEGETAKHTTDSAEIRRALEAKKTTWVDLGAPNADVSSLLADTLKIHALTVEDIWSDRPSPKVDEFPGYLYICAQTLKRKCPELQHCELDVVLGPTFIVTHDDARTTTDAMHEELTRSPRLLLRGAPWVAHAILDRLVDAYLPILDAFDDEVESLEDDVLAKAGTRDGQQGPRADPRLEAIAAVAEESRDPPARGAAPPRAGRVQRVPAGDPAVHARRARSLRARR